MSETNPDVTPVVKDSEVSTVEAPVVDIPKAESSVEPVAGSDLDLDRKEWVKSARMLRKQPESNPEPGTDTESVDTKVKTKVEVDTEAEVDVTPEVTTEEPEQTPPPIFKLSNGEELTEEQVLELKKGNMMNADYTRKTQELAEERKRLQQESGKYKDKPVEDAVALWEQLAMDPVGTIEYLREHYRQQGITEPEDPDVVAARVEAAKAKEEASKLKAEIDGRNLEDGKKSYDSYMDSLSEKYKDFGFDKQAVINYCRDNAILNPELGFKAMMFDPAVEVMKKKVTETSTQAEEQAKAAIASYLKDKVVTAANFDTPVGSGVSGSGVVVEKPRTLKDAKKAALARLKNMT